ncbi:MAG: glycoside hydrolase family 2 protein [Candidatus Brocadiia bacterium]
MIQELNDGWKLCRTETVDVAEATDAAEDWIDAEVPGCVHMDLMRADRIPDPFYGFNDEEVQWVADENWLYRTTFDASPDMLTMERVDLVCRGLDTFGTVVLNGTTVGEADNMFRTWRWDVTELLEEEGNELIVLFESPRVRGAALSDADGEGLSARSTPARAYTRKAQYASGWDWGPDLNTSGIWQPVYLEGIEGARLRDVWAHANWEDPDNPVIHVEADVEALADGSAQMKALLTDGAPVAEAAASADLTTGPNTLTASFRVEDPRLWWPRGAGPQELYTLTVEVEIDDQTLTRTRRIGLRRVELVREKDDEGESFVLHINGEPIFCRGANWIPSDNFLPRLTDADYEDLLHMAADANMNMLRVWGGGIYEQDRFYELCDELGIMVWQDFMLACAAYPEHLDDFRANVEHEAEEQVRRLRNHPSIVLWCGNNECQWHYGEGGGDHESLCEQVLPALCARLDPTRPYWPGSPYGGEEPNDPHCGDQHFWSTWWRWWKPESMRGFPGRFLSEFGLQAPPAPETVRLYIPSSGHHMQSRVMEHHNRAMEGTERIFRYLAAQFRVPCEFEDTVYLMQLAQAEGIKTGVDYWRGRKFLTAGALFWQFNDCWPVTSWSCVDCEHRPKALYHYARRFFSPVCPVIECGDGEWSVRVINDRLRPFKGELVWGVGRVTGDQLWSDRRPLEIPANDVAETEARGSAEQGLSDPTTDYLWCRIIEGDEEIARDTAFTLPIKHVDLPVPEWEAKVQPVDDRKHRVTLSSHTFAKGVWLRVGGIGARFSDNFFDVIPEVPVEILVTTARPLEAAELHRRLQIRSVAEVRTGDRA